MNKTKSKLVRVDGAGHQPEHRWQSIARDHDKDGKPLSYFVNRTNHLRSSIFTRSFRFLV